MNSSNMTFVRGSFDSSIIPCKCEKKMRLPIRENWIECPMCFRKFYIELTVHEIYPGEENIPIDELKRLQGS